MSKSVNRDSETFIHFRGCVSSKVSKFAFFFIYFASYCVVVIMNMVSMVCIRVRNTFNLHFGKRNRLNESKKKNTYRLGSI